MADEINYGWQKDFVAKPAKDAVEKDLTQSTLILDMENTLDEKFHWQVAPGEKADGVTSRPSSHPGSGAAHAVFVKLHTPVFYKLDNPQ